MNQIQFNERVVAFLQDISINRGVGEHTYQRTQ